MSYPAHGDAAVDWHRRAGLFWIDDRQMLRATFLNIFLFVKV
jgi:hypothetical protein